ncbi:hypothetical protein GCM10010191_82570 [Actinomadura vinacea]|uniref:HTH cro/C1-type domain-containing protein n=2 Tax=Actinomadura vinacea TaxID=115336 RepID=A0ABP5XHE5_9ACTN
MSQAQLAERLCVITGTYTLDRHYISRWERGKRKPVDWLPALAVALEVGLDVLEEAAARPNVQRLALTDPAHQAAALAERRHIDSSLAADLSQLLAANRRLEDRVGSATIKETVTEQTVIATRLAAEARGPDRAAMVTAAAGWEQFTGWLHASTGDHPTAIAHYRAALELAQEVGDHDMAATALSMRGHVAWMAGHTGPMIGLSQAAQRDAGRISPTVLALNVQQEARGHAIEGDHYRMEAGLDRAADLVARADSHPDSQYFYSPAFLEMQRGMAYRLAADSSRDRDDATAPGLYQLAINSLASGMAAFDPATMESEWATWYVAELARAYAGAAEPGPAAFYARRALIVAKAAAGARLIGSIEELHQEWATRWPDEVEVAYLGEDLAAG